MARKSQPNKPGKPRNKREGRPRGKHSKGGSDSKNTPPGDTFEIKMNAMANGGFALGTHQHRTAFVPYTIPGETVRVRVVEAQDKIDFAEGVELIEASADRVYPQCPHFGPGRCWGCQWQHIDYQAQLLLKQDVLADQLFRIGKFDDLIVERVMKPLIPSPEQWGYNFNMTMVCKNGGFGFYQIDGRSIEIVDFCHVLHPDLQALYEMLDIDFADLKHLSLWRGSDGETMIILEMSSEDAPELTADFPTSVNVILPDNEPVSLVGDSAIFYEISGRLFRMTAGGWFRANIAQIANLVSEVLTMLELSENDAVLDLYAGVGIFSAFMAKQAGLVTLVESYPPMATDAEENLKEFENVDIIEGSVEDVLQALIESGDIYEAAVLDPPSSGLSKDVMESLAELKIPKLVYISSDPSKFSKGLRELAKHGYQLQKIQPFDFAPQTYYVDAVALLVKA
jgi:23S rRNA (uracil1939-C5)-methyltransferase